MTTGFLPSASETLLGFQKETAWATLVSPATFKLLRFTGESLDIRRDNVVSQEIDPGRQVADLAQVGGGAGGGVNFELSYETFEDLLAAALFSDWEPAILSPSPSPAVVHTTLRNGVAPTSFTIQKKINTAVPAYFLYKGMMVDTLSLNIRAKQIVTGSMTFVGKSGALSTTVTGSDTQPNVKAIMNAASGIVVLDTVVSPVPKIIGMTLNIANGLREQPEISTVVAAGIGFGRCNITGTLQAYFENLTLANAFINGTSGQIQFTLGTVTAEKYTLNLPVVKLSKGTVVAGGNDQDVVVDCAFQAIKDPSTLKSIIITKAVA